MKRLYESVIKQHISEHEQMLFLAGPRKAGRSALCMLVKNLTTRFLYLNWDHPEHRKVILGDEANLIEKLELPLKTEPPLRIFYPKICSLINCLGERIFKPLCGAFSL